MKILMFVLLIFVSCSNGQVEPSKPNSKFLSKEEVYKLYKDSLTSSIDIKMTPEVMYRMKNLIPDAQFIEQNLFDMPANEFKSDIKEDEFKDVDLRDHDSGVIYRQLNGRCTAYSVNAVIENVASKMYSKKLRLSPAYTWFLDQNYSCKTKVDMVLQNYLIEEKYWHHDKNSPEINNVSNKGVVRVNHGYYLKDSLTNVKKALNEGLAVYTGMRTPNSMLEGKAIVSPNTTASNGGHALSIVGLYQYPDVDILILKNSWGESVGDHGYQYFPTHICKKDGFYCLFWTFDELKFR